MNYLRQVQRGGDFIEAHLEDGVTCADVARQARVSTWHFQRIFHALTGETLGSYIRGRRLTHSLDALQRPGARVIDVAVGAGFETQASFARAFRAAFGMTPSQYRALRDRFAIVKKVRLDEEHLRHLRGSVSLEPSLRQEGRRRFIGMRTAFYGVDSDKSNIGQKQPALWDAFLPRMREIARRRTGVAYGIVQPRAGSERLEYIACVEVDAHARIPRGMVAVLLAPARYAVFAHRGLPQALHRTVSYVYGAWLLGSGYRHTYAADLEQFDEEYKPGAADSVIRYAVPVSHR
jgi:AraC family transcriptional regulator